MITWTRKGVYGDKNMPDIFEKGNLRKEREFLLEQLSSSYISRDNYVSKEETVDSDQIANYIIVETQPLRPVDTVEVLYESEITLSANETKTITATYSKSPAIEAQIKPLTAVQIVKATYYSWGADIKLQNTSNAEQKVNLVVEGKPLEIRGAEKVFAKDDKSIREHGVIEYELPKNHLIQTKQMAQQIADSLLELYKDGITNVSVNWRGNPALELSDEVEAEGKYKNSKVRVARQSLEWDGALSATLEGRK